MPKTIVLPYTVSCPEGVVIEDTPESKTVPNVLLDHDIGADHIYERSCACIICRVTIHQGFDSLEEPTELKEGLPDRAQGSETDLRLSCQVVVADEDLMVEIPKCAINHAREEH